MFGLFKSDPVKKLKNLYEKKLEEAMHAQRSGKIPQYAVLIAESEEIAARMDALKRQA